jgi:6-phosphogluconolactonase
MTAILNRRNVLKGLAIAPFAAHNWWKQALAAESHSLLFVGTQTAATSKGIYAYRWDSNNGELQLEGLAAMSDNPTFLALSPDRKLLYAANELNEFQGAKSGAVSAFSISKSKLTALNVVSAQGTGTCHVSVHPDGKSVFCANYAGGSASMFHVESTGALTSAVAHFQYTGHGPMPQQEAAHAHRVTVSPDGHFLLVNDLGLDCIHIYKLENGTAVPNDPPQWNATPGTGPRALRFHPNGRWAYCVLEMGSAVEVLEWNSQAGALTSVQKVSLVPDGYQGNHAGSEVVVDRSGQFVYASDRFDDVIVSFKVDTATGQLTVLEKNTYGGKTPRHIALDPSEKWLLVANQDSDNITVLRRDTKTGLIAKTGKQFSISKPQCLVFV